MMPYTLAICVICSLLLGSCAQRETELMDIYRPSSMCAPQLVDTTWYNTDQVAPLFDGLDVLHYPITTSSNLAQRYFNQGLVLAYGFNHAEAARSFYYVTQLDPNCAMGYWGFAYVLGPNYNAGMESDNYSRAYEAIQRAISISIDCTQSEKDLINALSKRYVEKPIDNRGALDVAYSTAMKEVQAKYPDDADIVTLYAESIMNLHPWDLWSADGLPQPWTSTIEENLLRAISIDSNHIGAHHFYIHLVEASPDPDKGLQSARFFDKGGAPGAGHLVHMPSHIYIRTGDYHKGTLANIAAVEVDSNYITSCHAQGAYPLAYFPHNYHFMAATATLEGNSHVALQAAQKVADHANKQLMKEPGWGTIQHYYTIPYYVKVKFGKWNDILSMPNADLELLYPQGVRRYARGMAYVAQGDMNRAKDELETLRKIASEEDLKNVTIWEINSVYDLMQIARLVLEGELLAHEAHYSKAIMLLEEAVSIEDGLNYNEPPDWFFSVRHHLGAVQVDAGFYEDALYTYQEDLKRLPRNGWAMNGMLAAYYKINDEDRIRETNQQLLEIWKNADTVLSGSRVKG